MKTNKTKPIKKIMIFAIITVMIVSLFAVPAFAGYDASTGQWTVDETITYEEAFESFPTLAPEYSGLYTRIVAINFLYECFVESGGGTSGTYELLANPVKIIEIELSGNTEDMDLLVASSLIIDIDNESVIMVADGETFTYTIGSYDPFTFMFETVSGYSQLTTYGQDAFDQLALSSSSFNYITYIEPAPAEGAEQGIFAVWSQITQWIVNGLASVSNAFYANGELTLLGTLCLIPLGLGLALLLISIIQKFLHLRG